MMKTFETPVIEVMEIQVNDIVASLIEGGGDVGGSQSNPDWT